MGTQYGWTKIEGHWYGKHHKISSNKAHDVTKEVRSWSDSIRSASKLKVSVRIDWAIPQLLLYGDRLMHQLNPPNCQYICRDKKTLKHHWHQRHQYSIASHRDSSSRAKKEMVERQFNEASQHVHYERFFLNHSRS